MNYIHLTILLTFFLYLFGMSINAQITGRCLDAQTGEVVSGVAVRAGEVLVATTNEEGIFTIAGDTSIEVVFKHPGYQSTTQLLKTPGHNEVLINPVVANLQEVTVSAPLLWGKKREIAGSVSVLMQDSLHRQLEPVNLLNRVPGLFMQQGALNTGRVMIRGIGSRSPYATTRIRAFLDDIPLTTGDGNTTLEDLEIYDIARIEVIRGPSSTLFGNGLGGAIIFHPDHTIQGTSQWYLLSQTGSFGGLKGLINGGFKGQTSIFKTTLSHTRNEGFRENSRYRRSNASVMYRKHFKKHALFFNGNYIRLKAHIPSSLDRKTWQNAPESAAANWLSVKGYEKYDKWLSGLTLQSTFSRKLQNKAIIYLNYYDAYESRPFNILDDKALTTGFRDELTFKTDHLSLTAGGEIFNEHYTWKLIETLDGQEGNRLANNKETRNFINLFAKADYDFSSEWTISAGGNMHFLSYTLTDRFNDDEDLSGKYRYDPVFSPRIGINGELSGNINLFASAGHGFSVPSVEETLLPEGNINPNLKPEEGVNTEAGLRGTALNGHLHFDVTGYLINLKNLLVTKRESEAIFYGINAGKTRHYGLEVDLNSEWQLSQSGESKLAIDLTHTQMRNRFTQFTDDGIDFAGNRLPGLPNQHTRLTLTPTFNNLSFRAEWLHTGHQYLNDGNTVQYGGHHLFNLYGSLHINTKQSLNFRIETGINNLLNRHYASMVLVNAPSFGGSPSRYFYPGNPRNGFVRLTISM